MQARIFLCRHGETEWTRSGQHTSRTDLPLTARGRDQALWLKERLEEVAFQAVYASPMLRARETCEGAGFASKMVIELDAVEWDYGSLEGLKTMEIRQKESKWDLFLEGAPGGESPEQIAKRSDRLVEKFLKKGGNIALFSHGHFLRVFAARWLGLEVKEGRLFALSVASISVLGFEREQRVVHAWNITQDSIS